MERCSIPLIIFVALLCTCPNRSTSFSCWESQSCRQHCRWCPQEWSRGTCWPQGSSLGVYLCAVDLWPCHTPLHVPDEKLYTAHAKAGQHSCFPELPAQSKLVDSFPVPEQLQDVLLLLAVTPPQGLLLSAEIQCSRGMTSLERNPTRVSWMKSGRVLCRVLFNRHWGEWWWWM